jgi:hypothetical protein
MLSLKNKIVLIGRLFPAKVFTFNLCLTLYQWAGGGTMEKLDNFDTDEGCYDGKYFLHRLRQEKRRAERTDAHLTIIIYDFSAYEKMLKEGSALSAVGE